MASGFTTGNDEHLIRSELWSKQIKQLLMDDLMGTKYVKILTEFPDGTTFTIPTLGEAEHRDFVEGQAVKYDALDTGEYQFSFDKYVYSAHSVSEKFKRDSFYASDVITAFAPREHRAIMTAVEARILSRGPDGQTASNTNTINGAEHRWVGSGTSESMHLTDFAKADYALRKANVPASHKVAIVDASVAHTIQTMTNATSLLSPMPKWGNMVNTGLVTGTQFAFSLYGFDVYISNYLKQDMAETIGAKSVTTGVANLFFSAAPGDTLPFIGGFRQMPTVQSKFNMDLQQEEFLTIAEYGFKLYRPENMVVVLTDTDVVV